MPSFHQSVHSTLPTGITFGCTLIRLWKYTWDKIWVSGVIVGLAYSVKGYKILCKSTQKTTIYCKLRGVNLYVVNTKPTSDKMLVANPRMKTWLPVRSANGSNPPIVSLLVCMGEAKKTKAVLLANAVCAPVNAAAVHHLPVCSCDCVPTRGRGRCHNASFPLDYSARTFLRTSSRNPPISSPSRAHFVKYSMFFGL